MNSSRISLGEKILLQQDTNSDKAAGVKAFLEGDCETAIKKFKEYHKAKPRDPEALIYLNNAKARQKEYRLRIAVSGPIGTNPNIAEEMLRGVAQAQNEVNNSGGINGKLLEVAIANDDNDTSEAQNIAQQFVKDQTILAVVGHNASEAAAPAALVYKSKKLVMLSPTSFDQHLSGLNYIFRTVNTNNLAKGLSDYIIKTTTRTNIVICVDSDSADNQSFANEFTKAIQQTNSKINPTPCNLSDNTLDPNDIISKARKNGADSLFLAPHIDRIDKALQVARANRGRLKKLFSTPTMYTQETLAHGKNDVKGMVLAVPWHPEAISGNPFPKKAYTLWGGDVNWRTATTYDATNVVIAGLRNSNTREELQERLNNTDFSVDGATGKIQFSSGDLRNAPIYLLKVQQKPGTDEYGFVPIKP